MKITDREKKFLLEIARESMRSWMSGSGFRYEPSLQPIISLDRPTVLEDGGAMISLYKEGKLIAHTEKLDQKYPLFLVGDDYNEAAIKVTRANLIKADIWAKEIGGDIGRRHLLAKT